MNAVAAHANKVVTIDKMQEQYNRALGLYSDNIKVSQTIQERRDELDKLRSRRDYLRRLPDVEAPQRCDAQLFHMKRTALAEILLEQCNLMIRRAILCGEHWLFNARQLEIRIEDANLDLRNKTEQARIELIDFCAIFNIPKTDWSLYF